MRRCGVEDLDPKKGRSWSVWNSEYASELGGPIGRFGLLLLVRTGRASGLLVDSRPERLLRRESHSVVAVKSSLEGEPFHFCYNHESRRGDRVGIGGHYQEVVVDRWETSFLSAMGAEVSSICLGSS